MAEDPVSVRRVRRDGVLVEGPDSLSWLQGQLTQDISDMADGESRLTLVLSPQGKVDSYGRVTALTPERFLLDVEAGYGASLLERLSRFKLRVKATLQPVEMTCEEHTVGGFDALGPPVMGGEPVGGGREEVFEAARIAAGVPRLGRELTDKTIPQEAGEEFVARTVSFTKGCYTGQELVARIDARGSNVPRRIRLLRGTGPAPAPGDAVLNNGDDVGTVTSSAAEGDGGFVALALLRRAVLESGTLALEVSTANGVLEATLSENGGG